MSNGRDLNAAIAVTRFGLGARPGEIAAAGADPRDWLTRQIRREGADQPQPFTAPPAAGDTDPPLPDALPSSRDRLLALVAYRDQVKALKASFRADSALAALPVPAAPPAVPGAAVAAKPPNPARDEIKAAHQPILAQTGQEILARARLAALTDAPFRERWTLFWANHFTVAAKNIETTALVGPFEREAIRPHVFGRFQDLLIASSTHPAMLLYLDQAKSAGPDSLGGVFKHMGLNENLGREILELHTVGPDAGYTQADVTEFARALTGYSIAGRSDRDPGGFMFRPAIHEPGPRRVMGRTYGEGGAEQARAVLIDLAADPHTADHLARKLAIHFVADDPPPALVARLRGAYLDSGGDLAHVARTLVEAPEAWDPRARKLKTPYELLVSGYRAADAAPGNVRKEVVQPLTAFGHRPFSAPQPNGWSEQAADWAAPNAVVKRLTWAAAFAQYYAPTVAPDQAAQAALGDRLTPATLTAVRRAETRPEAFALLLMSPEFQRR